MTSKGEDIEFIETKQYQRFQEFCDACRKYQYIGLCYGVPGVGKTVSARYYINPSKVTRVTHHLPSEGVLEKGLDSKVALYTPSVVNSPGQIGRDLGRCGVNSTNHLLNHLQKQEKPKIEAMEENMNHTLTVASRAGAPENDVFAAAYRQKRTAYFAAWKDYQSRRREIRNAPLLLLIDEADRLKMASLEQLRALFDQGGMGLVLIGMPGLEKRMARYPQLYSRVGFVHEFTPLSQADVRQLLREGWGPLAIPLPAQESIDEDALATLIRVAEGQFRVLYRLLQQISRVLEINRLDKVTREVVEAARESLVIGTA